MTPVSFVAWLLLVLAYATTHQVASGAEPWGLAREPTWGDEPVYRRGYETPPTTQDREPQYLDAHRADDVRRDLQGGWSGAGYGDDDRAPVQGRGLDGFIDRDGRWVEYAREPTEHSRDVPYNDGPGRYSASPWTGDSDSRAEMDDRDARGGWREATPPPAYRNAVSGPVNPYPEYRFRGDPQPSSGRWGGSDGTQGYRFRPLTDREAQQRSQTPGWRPIEPGRSDRGERASAPAGLMDALTPPARTFGFEPRPGP